MKLKEGWNTLPHEATENWRLLSLDQNKRQGSSGNAIAHSIHGWGGWRGSEPREG